MSETHRIATTIAEKRGARFEGDNAHICAYITRNKNGNVVVYQAAPPGDAAGGKGEVLDAYWLDIDPEYQRKSRAKGKMTDRDELNRIDKMLAYGISVAAAKPKDVADCDACGLIDAAELQFPRHTVNFVALASRPMVLSWVVHPMRGPLPVLRGTMLGRPGCIVERIYVHAEENFIGLPSVKYIDIFGFAPDTLEQLTERVTR
jgi:hypothetical protein